MIAIIMYIWSYMALNSVIYKKEKKSIYIKFYVYSEVIIFNDFTTFI